MVITLAYWRGLVGESNPTSDFGLAQKFAGTMQLPPLQWVEEQEALHLAWSERTLGAALTSMQQGDSLLVNRMLMLATSMDECCQIIAYLLEKQIFFYALDALCYLDKPEHFPVWRHALAIFQQFQWNMRSDSTKRGIQRRRELGLPIGRPTVSKLDEYRGEIVFLLTHGATQSFIADRYGSSRQHLSYWLKRRGIRIPLACAESNAVVAICRICQIAIQKVCHLNIHLTIGLANQTRNWPSEYSVRKLKSGLLDPLTVIRTCIYGSKKNSCPIPSRERLNN